MAGHRVFSKIDLTSAYHQIPLKDDEKKYTAFEANGRLYHFKRLPFGLTNGVAAFQRTIDSIIEAENLHGAIAYLDDVIISGPNSQEHDLNLKRFREAAKSTILHSMMKSASMDFAQ